jgi:hypothetical protein
MNLYREQLFIMGTAEVLILANSEEEARQVLINKPLNRPKLVELKAWGIKKCQQVPPRMMKDVFNEHLSSEWNGWCSGNQYKGGENLG